MSLATLPLLPALLLSTRILQGFRMFAGFFLADQVAHPAFERLGRQPVLAAIIRARHSALTPCRHVRENQIWNDTALLESRARFGRLRTTYASGGCT